MRRRLWLALAVAVIGCRATEAPDPAQVRSFEHAWVVDASKEGKATGSVAHVSTWNVPLVDPEDIPVVIAKGHVATVTVFDSWEETKDLSRRLIANGVHAAGGRDTDDGSTTWTVTANHDDVGLEVELGFGPVYADMEIPPIARVRYRVTTAADH